MAALTRPTPPREAVRDFPALIRWIAEAHHGGRPFHIAGRLRISSGTVWHWLSRTIQTPQLDTLRRLCRAYDLDLPWVLSLIPAHAELLAELKLWRFSKGVPPTPRRPQGAARAVRHWNPQAVDMPEPVTGDYVKFATLLARRLWIALNRPLPWLRVCKVAI